MPYVTCGRCGLRTFSAAYWSSVDYCDGCGMQFPRTPRRISVARVRQLMVRPANTPSDRGGSPRG